MKTDFDYSVVPNHFAHCLNDQCLRAGECLRQLIVPHVPTTCHTFTVVNPSAFQPDGKDCPYYKADKPVRYAQGMTRMLDDLPHKSAVSIKDNLQYYFGHTQYYHARRGIILITPGEQRYIKQLFIRHGIQTEPAFDAYVEAYSWLE